MDCHLEVQNSGSLLILTEITVAKRPLSLHRAQSASVKETIWEEQVLLFG